MTPASRYPGRGGVAGLTVHNSSWRPPGEPPSRVVRKVVKSDKIIYRLLPALKCLSYHSKCFRRNTGLILVLGLLHTVAAQALAEGGDGSDGLDPREARGLDRSKLRWARSTTEAPGDLDVEADRSAEHIQRVPFTPERTRTLDRPPNSPDRGSSPGSLDRSPPRPTDSSSADRPPQLTAGNEDAPANPPGPSASFGLKLRADGAGGSTHEGKKLAALQEIIKPSNIRKRNFSATITTVLSESSEAVKVDLNNKKNDLPEADAKDLAKSASVGGGSAGIKDKLVQSESSATPPEKPAPEARFPEAEETTLRNENRGRVRLRTSPLGISGRRGGAGGIPTALIAAQARNKTEEDRGVKRDRMRHMRTRRPLNTTTDTEDSGDPVVAHEPVTLSTPPSVSPEPPGVAPSPNDVDPLVSRSKINQTIEDTVQDSSTSVQLQSNSADPTTTLKSSTTSTSSTSSTTTPSSSSTTTTSTGTIPTTTTAEVVISLKGLVKTYKDIQRSTPEPSSTTTEETPTKTIKSAHSSTTATAASTAATTSVKVSPKTSTSKTGLDEGLEISTSVVSSTSTVSSSTTSQQPTTTTASQQPTTTTSQRPTTTSSQQPTTPETVDISGPAVVGADGRQEITTRTNPEISRLREESRKELQDAREESRKELQDARDESRKELLDAIRRKISKSKSSPSGGTATASVNTEQKAEGQGVEDEEEGEITTTTSTTTFTITSTTTSTAPDRKYEDRKLAEEELNSVTSPRPLHFRPFISGREQLETSFNKSSERGVATSLPIHAHPVGGGAINFPPRVKIFLNVPEVKPGTTLKISNVSHIQDKLARLNAAITEGLKLQRQKEEEGRILEKLEKEEKLEEEREMEKKLGDDREGQGGTQEMTESTARRKEGRIEDTTTRRKEGKKEYEDREETTTRKREEEVREDTGTRNKEDQDAPSNLHHSATKSNQDISTEKSLNEESKAEGATEAGREGTRAGWREELIINIEDIRISDESEGPPGNPGFTQTNLQAPPSRGSAQPSRPSNHPSRGSTHLQEAPPSSVPAQLPPSPSLPPSSTMQYLETGNKLEKKAKLYEHPSSHYRPQNETPVDFIPMPKSNMEPQDTEYILTQKKPSLSSGDTRNTSNLDSERNVDKKEVIEEITNTTVYVVAVVAIIPIAALFAWFARIAIRRKALAGSEISSETGLSRPITEDDSLQQAGTRGFPSLPHLEGGTRGFPSLPPLPHLVLKVQDQLDTGPQVDAGGIWEFARANLHLQTVLGEGNFGKVWKAEADNICEFPGTSLVAVKTVKETSGGKEVEDLVQEMNIMKEIGPHPNVVSILGVCTQQEPFLLIMEYVMYGKLLTHLRDQRVKQSSFFNFTKESTELPETLTAKDLTKFAYGVAKGMEFIVSKGIIHRDLAARNILVDHNKTCKISDFGLSRNLKDLGGEMYEQKTKGALPIRWMAPESLYFSVFTPKSDVWGFGILMWEIVTLGSTPYPGMGAREVMRRVRDGYRLERPAHCHPQLYHIIQRCWAGDMNKRPDFMELRKDLAKLLEDQHGYIDLQNISDTKYYSMDQNPDEEEKL